MKVEDCFYIGYVTKTKGLKGEIQLFFEYSEPDELSFKTLFIEINGKLVPFFVSSHKLHDNQTGNFYLDDIGSIEAAERIVRKKVYLPNTQKPKRKNRAFSYLDLKGFMVHDEKYGQLGEIKEVLDFPQQFIAVVPFELTEIMFPLNDFTIKLIDEKNNVLSVLLPDGLIDIYIRKE